ncbi:hypothetical protein ABPG74_008150 [Tetrahymena malaccensis]
MLQKKTLYSKKIQKLQFFYGYYKFTAQLHEETKIIFIQKVKVNVKLSETKQKFNKNNKIHYLNNSVIKYVLTHKYYNLVFIQYYGNGCLENWVNKNRVGNKYMLKNWVSYLVQCIQTPSLLENIDRINYILKAKKMVNEKL